MKYFCRRLFSVLISVSVILTLPGQIVRGAGESPAVTSVSASSGKIASGTTIQVVSEQAMTYPTSTKNNVPYPAYYPLPKGTRDVVTGSRISYKKNNVTYYYYNLKSGLRVSADDIKAISADAPSRNTIDSVKADYDKDYTYVRVDTQQKVAFKVKYTADSISFEFQQTIGSPDIESFPSSGMISGAQWKNSTLTLKFRKSGTFMGYKAYYSKLGELILRFNNMPSSIKQARIAIDAGHGGTDKGAIGSNSKYHEKDINLAIARLLKTELERRGATVLLIGGNKTSAHRRRQQAEEWEADILVSIHGNSATNKKATGSEVYYFQSFNKSLATNTSKKVSSGLDTLNRGAKRGIFHVTLSSQMRSVLVETGFISNQAEYKKLIKKAYWEEIADGIADSVQATFKPPA